MYDRGMSSFLAPFNPLVHRIAAGTRIPPSYSSHLPPRNGKLFEPALFTPPLSLKNKISVSFAISLSSNACRI